MTGAGPAPGLGDDVQALCIGIAAMSGALRGAMERGDIGALIAREAELRAMAGQLPVPGQPGVTSGQVLGVLVEALSAVRAAEAWLEARRARDKADARQTERLRLAYGDGGRRF
ncbi:hypothetical protein ACN9JG_07545 [Cereibacter azotoformans]|uniref:hypothetical protein n=1 Tax=Cereibacter azotoformans TaxID=43057 RepID=UPI003B20E3BA